MLRTGALVAADAPTPRTGTAAGGLARQSARQQGAAGPDARAAHVRRGDAGAAAAGAVAIGLYAIIAGDRSGRLVDRHAGRQAVLRGRDALELGLICLLAPALTADLISGERERSTLDLLLVTPLSRLQIVVGKLVAALGRCCC